MLWPCAKVLAVILRVKLADISQLEKKIITLFRTHCLLPTSGCWTVVQRLYQKIFYSYAVSLV